MAAELEARHREPHRRYHTLTHVGETLAEANRLLDLEPGADPVAVALALWFHDAVHDPTDDPGRSERASADLVVDRLPALERADRDRLAAEAGRLVLLTAGHLVEAGDPSGSVVVDADLWILSAPPGRYDRYVADVRAEYPHVAEESWRTGRGAVVGRFLDTVAQLYTAGPADDRGARRDRARTNLSRELADLART